MVDMRSTLGKAVLATALVAGWLVGAASVQAQFEAPLQDVPQPVRIGTESDPAPFKSPETDGLVPSFDIELGNKMCAVAKLRCRWVSMPFDRMIPALLTGKIDAILTQMSITDERRKLVDFSDIVTIAPARFVAAKNSGISDDPATLKGKTVGIQSGTTMQVYYNTKLKPLGIKAHFYESQDQAFLDLDAGRIDADLADETADWDWLSKTGRADGFDFAGKAIVDPTIFGPGTGIAVRKGDAKLVSALNAALAETIRNGTFKTINNEYFPFSLRPK